MTRTLECEICGAMFECKGPLSFGCWCSNVPVTKEKRMELKEKAGDCVCPHCLSD